MSNNFNESQSDENDRSLSTATEDSFQLFIKQQQSSRPSSDEDEKASKDNAKVLPDSDQCATEYYVLDILKQQPKMNQDLDLSTDEFLHEQYRGKAYETEGTNLSSKNSKSKEQTPKILEKDPKKLSEIEAQKVQLKDQEIKFKQLKDQNVKENSEELNRLAAEIARCYNRLGMKCHGLSLFSEAFAHLEASLMYYIYLKQKKETADIYDALGFISFKLAKVDKAIELYEKALKIKESIFGTEHPKLALTYYELAKIYFSKANLQEAEPKINHALKLLANKPEENIKLITLINFTHAQMLAQNGELTQARLLLIDVLERTTKALGENHRLVGRCYSNLADVETKRQTYDQAAFLLEKAYNIEKLTKKRNPLQLANLTNKLGVLYLKQKSYKAAIQHFLSCYEVRKELYTIKHPEVAMAILQIADVYTRIKEFDKAQGQVLNALKIYTAYYGKAHPTLATCYHSLGNIAYSMKKYTEAKEHYSKSLVIDLQFYPKGHPQLSQTYEGLAYVAEKLGNKQEALENYQLLYAIRKKELGSDHRDVVGLKNLIHKLTVV